MLPSATRSDPTSLCSAACRAFVGRRAGTARAAAHRLRGRGDSHVDPAVPTSGRGQFDEGSVVNLHAPTAFRFSRIVLTCLAARRPLVNTGALAAKLPIAMFIAVKLHCWPRTSPVVDVLVHRRVADRRPIVGVGCVQGLCCQRVHQPGGQPAADIEADLVHERGAVITTDSRLTSIGISFPVHKAAPAVRRI
jgi:hypothetical protein